MSDVAEMIVRWGLMVFALNFFVASIWITALLWFKLARTWTKLTKE